MGGRVHGGEVGCFFELVAPGLQGAGTLAEVADAWAEHVVADGASLEGEDVALDGRFGLLELGGRGVDLVAVVPEGLGELVVLERDGAGDEVGVGVEGEERVEDGGFEDIRADALAVAGLFAVALAGEAGVVAVAVASSGRGDADVVASAALAGDEPGQEVVGMGVGHATVVALATLAKKGLGLVEQVGVDEGRICLVADVAEGDLAEVAAVAQDEQNRLG
ncbi:MAG: hypothetical protein M0010_06815 [Actinomycetota bacterium]|nr:hypothetical protein [Actinomycetota bacterium]MDA8357697.1 hypothetical protein [Actinomycetota bacterium]